MSMTNLLAHMGYISTFPQAVAFSLKYYGGSRIQSLVGIILSEKVTLRIRHIRSNSSIGKQITILLEWAQHSSKTSIPILEDTRE
eukprot:12509221-Ditylum_brightwellii.AAC.1